MTNTPRTNPRLTDLDRRIVETSKAIRDPKRPNTHCIHRHRLTDSCPNCP